MNTKAGGRKAANTNKERHGDDFYKRIGSIGGRKGHTGGFFANRELARAAGAKGGKISRRGKAKKNISEVNHQIEEPVFDDGNLEMLPGPI